MDLEDQAFVAVAQTCLFLGSWYLRFGVGENVLRALVNCGTPETVVAPKWVGRLDQSSPRDEITDGKC